MLESNQCVTGLEYWRMAKGQHEIHQTCPAHCLSGPRLLEASCTKFQRSENRQQSSAGRFADSQSGSRDISVFVHFHCLDSARDLRAKSCAGVIEIACSQTTEAVNCRSLHSRRRRGACLLTRRPFRGTGPNLRRRSDSVMRGVGSPPSKALAHRSQSVLRAFESIRGQHPDTRALNPTSRNSPT